MAAQYMIAAGKMVGGNVEIRVALPPRTDDAVLAAMNLGRRLYEAGAAFSCCQSQHEQAGWLEAEYEATTALLPLQDFIDYAAELEDLQEDMEDRAYWASGAW